MIHDKITEMISNGVFKKLLKAGIISSSVKTQYEIYQAYATEKKKGNKCVRDIVSDIAENNKVGETTVYRAIKKMQEICD